MGTSKCNITTAKEKISQKFRLCNTCFTYVGVVVGKCYSSHTKNRNHVHKDQNNLLSSIITLETNVCGGDTVFIMLSVYKNQYKEFM